MREKLTKPNQTKPNQTKHMNPIKRARAKRSIPYQQMVR